MTAVEYLTHLRSLGVMVSADGDRLRINAPTGAVTMRMQEELRARKLEILDVLNEAARAGSGFEAIPRASREERIPLSIAQQRIWFMHGLGSGGALYNIKKAYRLTGSLNIHALQHALDALVARHEALRTRVVAIAGDPEQVVDPPRHVPLRIIDWSRRERTKIQGELPSLLRKEARHPYDLAEELILRAVLVRLNEDEHVLFLGLHHIAADGWSLSILLRELGSLYNAAISGNDAVLPELPIQYADYAAWQHNRHAGRFGQSAIAHWRQRLAGVSTLELPTDRPPPSTPSLRGSYHSFALTTDLTARLKELAQTEHVTLYVLLISAFNAVLHRYTGQTDLLIGSPIANRNRRELESLIGLFISTMVVRTDVSGNPTFRELVGRVQRWILDSLDFADVPFEQLDVWGSGGERSGSLLRSLFVFQNLPKTTFQLEGLKIERMPNLSLGVAKFDLSLIMRERPPHLLGGFSYSVDLFDKATITRLAAHFEAFLSAAAFDPDRRIGDIPLLTTREREQIVVEWNRTEAPVEHRLVHETFEARAIRSPQSLALIYDGRRDAHERGTVEQLSYGEVNARAEELANRLRMRGIGRGAVVGLCMERSVEVIIGLLGILKTGAAYLPLDPSYPAERLAYMIADARPNILLTQHRLRERIPRAGVEVMAVDDAVDVASGPETRAIPPAGQSRAERDDTITDTNTVESPNSVESPKRPPETASSNHESASQKLDVTANGRDLAYIIYTSGSTGRPKGVQIEHRSLSNLTCQAARAYGIGPADRVLQFASISFDAAAEEIFCTLTEGAALVLCNPRDLGSMRDFTAYCHAHGVTVLDLPTSFWHELVGAMATGETVLPPSVRVAIIGGERARPDRVATWFRITSVRLFNTYGPTETTVITTLHELTGDTSLDKSCVPIGRPIGNTTAYVLDRHMNPVPPGMKGELYVGGLGVARGYLNQPDLTLERFLPNPFGSGDDRLYRTGDIVRFRSDGILEYLGRADDQVKIRGFRVELGEIQAALEQHRDVAACAVGLWDEDAGREKLIAYVVARPDSAFTPQELSRFLGQRLPAFMIPTAFVAVASLPTLPNGKVDRELLPASFPAARSPSQIIRPRTAAESQLTDIWSDVLGLDTISIDDNFFDLGGHSLLVMRVLARVREAFGRDLPVRSMFEAPTIAGMAQVITGVVEAEAGHVRPAIVPVSRVSRTVAASSLVNKPHE